MEHARLSHELRLTRKRFVASCVRAAPSEAQPQSGGVTTYPEEGGFVLVRMKVRVRRPHLLAG